MKRVITIAKAMIKSWLRSRSGVFFSVMFPVMLLLIFASVFGGDGGTKFVLYVQNLDQTSEGKPTQLSQAFVDALNQTGAFDLKIVPPADNPRSYVQDKLGPFGGTFRLLIIPSDFQHDVLNGSIRARLGVISTTLGEFVQQGGQFIAPDQRHNIEQGLRQIDLVRGQLRTRNVSLVYVADSSNTGSTIAQSIIDSFAKSFNYQIIGVQSNIRLEPDSVIERRFRGIDYYLPGLIGAFIMTNGIIGVTTNVTEYRRRGILKRLAITPLNRLEWILANVLSQALLSFLLVTVMTFIAWAVFGLRALPDAITVVLIIAGAVLFSGIGLVLSGVITDVEAASAAGNAIAFPMMFLSGSFWPLEIMPIYLQAISRVLPLTYFSEGLRSSIIYHHLPSTLTNLGITAALAVLFIGVGSAVTKWRES